MRKFILILLITYLAGSLFASEPLDVKEITLDNGLQVYLYEMHTTPIIISNLYYRVGSRNENVGITGISHVCEHMMFKGTDKFQKGEVAKVIKRNGGVFNAFTSTDMTMYFEQMPKNRIDIALEIESDRMMNSIFDPDEFVREVEVIKEERRMRTQDNADALLVEEMNAVFFKSHPYRWPVIGWMNDLQNITREQAYQYYQTYYTPNNAILVLVGDFETEEMIKKVKYYYNDIPGGPEIPKLNITEPQVIAEKEVSLRRSEVKNTNVLVYLPGIESAHPDRAALTLGRSILLSSSNDRLYKRLVLSRKASYIRIGLSGGLEAKPIALKFDVLPGSSKEENLKIVMEEIGRLKNELVSEYELEKEKNRYRAGEFLNKLKVSEVANRIGSYEFYADDYRAYDRYMDEIKDMTQEKIRDTFQKYFDMNTATIGVIIPDSNAINIAAVNKPESSARNESDDYGDNDENENDENENDNEDVLVTSEREDDSFSIDDIIRPNPVGKRIKEGRLDNGIRVFLMEDHLAPYISLMGETYIGNTTINDVKPDLGSITLSVMNRGTKTKTFQEIQDRLHFLAASAMVGGGDESIIFSASGLTDKFEEALDIMKEKLFEPSFPDDQLELIKKLTTNKLLQVEKQAGWIASKELYKQIYDGHPYSRFASMNAEVIGNITREDVLEFYRKYIHMDSTFIVVVGDFKNDQMLELLNRKFGYFAKHGAVIESYPPQSPIGQTKLIVVNKPENTQLTIRIGHETVEKGSADYDICDLANHILGGSSLTSRLGKNIRDKQGLAYGVNSRIKSRKHGGAWFIESKTAPENGGQLVATALLEMKRMQDEPISDAELTDVKKYLLSIIPMIIETPQDLQKEIFEQVRYNKSPGELDNYFDLINAITKEDILRISKKYFHPDKSIIVVAGPIEKDEFLQQFEVASQNLKLDLKLN